MKRLQLYLPLLIIERAHPGAVQLRARGRPLLDPGEVLAELRLRRRERRVLRGGNRLAKPECREIDSIQSIGDGVCVALLQRSLAVPV